ncbi:MAG: hypothetical protein LBT25_07340 [Candidatus Symbiothrix sp.]|jgi:hypothetical protein|nr:hypothetical protein [Candidatus Symbiothrix sp.]
MKFTLPQDMESIRYDFQFYKNHIYKKTSTLELETKGEIRLLRKASERFENSLEYIFRSDKFIQKGVSDPLVFNPVKWIFNLQLNTSGIDEKGDLKLIWNRYRDKYRKQENLIAFKLLENLYFNIPLGMEYQAFSNTPYLVFFINLFENEIEKETVVKGLDWILMPMSIPVNTTFRCTNLDERRMELNGWISLDDEKMDVLMSDKQFKETAKSYHFSKNFSMESQIKVIYESKTSYLHFASFDLEVKGEDGKLHEEMRYEINGHLPFISQVNAYPKNQNSCIIDEVKDSNNKKSKWSILD